MPLVPYLVLIALTLMFIYTRTMDAKFWDERYKTDEYAYGEMPNGYLVEKLSGLTPGKILFPADGEGRNGVYAATLGWDVYSFDQSAEGKRKAELLAAKKGVTIHYDLAEMPAVNYQPGEFDAMALIYAFFSGDNKAANHKQLATFLKPGGIVIFEAYSKRHLQFNTVNPQAGGPRDEAMLFSIEEIKEYFSDFEILELQEQELEIWEGNFHGGMSAVIRFMGRKKSKA